MGEVCAEQGADLIALSWSQDSSGDRATGIREVLAASPIPVLLLPAATLDMGPVDLSATAVSQPSGPELVGPRA